MAVYLRSWYLCTCGAAISSKVWEKRFAVAWQKRQRYYCCLCHRQYKHSFGQVVETKLESGGEPCFALAAVPPEPLEDVRARGHELSIKPATPQALYDALAQYKPTTAEGGVFRPCSPAEVWNQPDKMTKEEAAALISVLTPEGKRCLEQVPVFNWFQVFNWV